MSKYIQTFTFIENVARSDVPIAHEKVSWFFYQSQHYILMCKTFTFWFDWDFYQLMFLSITIYKEIPIFTFPFYFNWDFYQLIFFSISKCTSAHTIFHFSFQVDWECYQLIFFSISKYTHMHSYIEESIDILINSNWFFCQLHFEHELTFISIIDININKIAFCSTKV